MGQRQCSSGGCPVREPLFICINTVNIFYTETVMSAMKCNLISSLVLSTLVAIFSNPVFASTVDDKIKAADLVFEGTVVNVQTRFSQRDSDSDPAVPYRFVTYQVSRILKGNYQGGELTLRFLGGESDDGQVLLIPGQPLFDVGDHDLLMVSGNNRFPCPLVQCGQGRYRYLGGMVVNELGQRIYLDANGQIVLGEKIENEELTTNKLSDNITIETHEVNETDVGEITNVLDDYPNASSTDPAGFASSVEATVQRNYSAEELANLPEFKSSDPDAPFIDPTYEKAGFVAGQPPEQGGEATADMPEEERLERERDAALQAEREGQPMSPEQAQAAKEYAETMAKLHPEFYAGTADSGVIAAANAATDPLPAAVGAEAPEPAFARYLGYLLAVALVIMLLVLVRYVRRRQ